MMRKTKIVATLGPACASADGVYDLVRAGIDVARLNFSHGSHDEHRRFFEWVEMASERAGRPIAVMQDIQGPKIRVGSFAGGSVDLEKGERVRLLPGDEEGSDDTVYVAYPGLDEEVGRGESVLLEDGLIRLEVVGTALEGLEAEVAVGGRLSDHAGVAFPDSELRTLSVTEKDERDLRFGRELGVDFVAASFVRSAADVERVREHVGEGVPVIAKIELASGYQNLDSILETAAGVMVARGDLGVQLALERIPLIQLDILRRANLAGGLSITATEMLESMTEHSRPTRAEVTDVANAVLSGTDAVMLSAETATGAHPARVVEVMDTVCREAEKSLATHSERLTSLLLDEEPFPSASAKAAVDMSIGLDISTIVAFTESGATGRLLSKYRPQADIVAFTPEPTTHRRMALYWGVTPFLFERKDSTDEMIAAAERRLVERGLVSPGDALVMVAGVPPNQRRSTNLVKLHRVGE